MQDIKLILAILGVLITIVIGLISYIIKTKDATEKATKETLKELSTLITAMTQSVLLMKVELDNNIYNTRKHDEALAKHNDLISSIRVLGTKMNGRVNSIETAMVELKKVINNDNNS